MSLAIHDEARVAAAFELPVAAIYRRTGLLWQRLSALCGPTTVALVLRSLGHTVDARTILDGTGLATLFGRRIGGMTLDQVAQVAREKSKRTVTVLRHLDLTHFRDELSRLNDPRRRYLANFHRPTLRQRGGGHHSPLGAYLDTSDEVLVLDTNKRYGPWLIATPLLYAALQPIDPGSGQKRGIAVVE